ncbi:MAG: amino acid adenylation domain-containing protein, partial [Pyrinomonadaceae bacterium]
MINEEVLEDALEDVYVFPVSFAQQRLWFLDQLEPGSTVYNIPVALRLGGRLDEAALERTLTEVVRRHESLRTTFAVEGGEPVQVVHPPAPVPLPVIDLSDLPEGEREERAQRHVNEEAQRPFDLTAGPLLRAGLVKLGEEDYVALFTMHHIVSDGWSMGVLVREVAALYQAFSQGEPSPLPELPVQYADYASWQREWLRGEVLEEQLGYWRGQLGGAPSVLELPTDRPRPKEQVFGSGVQAFELNAGLTAKLRALCKREDATMFMVLLAVWQLLLARYSGQDDILVGTPIANRTRGETEDLIGFFVNTLVLRGKISGEMRFSDYLGQVKETCLEAYAHQHVPFEKVVEELQPDRDLGRNPLFQVMFVLQNAPGGELNLPGLKLAPVGVEANPTQFDMALTMIEREQSVHGFWEHSAALFDVATIERMAGHFERLLEEVAAAPRRKLSELEMLCEEERRRLLVEWNRTARDRAAGLCLHELFERQAARTPEAVAVVCGPRQVTYAELNERANRLAHHLRSAGVGPESLVGVLMERSVEMLVALLATLKAGGAYVPLDPAYPTERLAFTLEDAGARVLLTQENLAGRVSGLDLKVIRLDSDWEAIAARPADNPAAGARAENAAYVIYTSGSTGRPKGVVCRHGSVVNYVESANAEFRIGPADRVLQFASVSFDASAEEVYTTLTGGGTLVLRDDAMLATASAFLRRCREWGLTVLDLPTAYWQELVAGATPAEWDSAERLRLVVIGGEKAVPERVAAWHEAVRGRVRLVNTYGPTEATIVATSCDLTPGAREAWREVPIGRPVANAQAYVLDAHLRPVPAGVTGELHVGGAGLARGYLKRPGLTAEKFIPHPFAAEPGARLYRTGDLVRHLPDGNLEFVGRADDQVKLRGFRIELGEIESALRTHAAVAEAVVVTREDGQAGKRVVAYVVPAASAEATAAELREYLRGRLPDYMVPQAFVTLRELPLTPSGKIDRRGLPAPDPQGGGAEFSAPRGAIEEIVAGVWAEVLGAERVGAEDNFFELGGHSLLATRAVSRLREALGVELPLRSLFERPTPRLLAGEVETLLRGGVTAARPPLRVAVREGAVPLSFAQQRLWFLDQLEPGSSTYNIPAAVRLRGALNVEALGGALTEVVRRHESLRTTFAAEGGEPVQLIHPPSPVPLPVVDLRDLPADERYARTQQLVNEEAQRPFDLSAGPLLRAGLLRLSAEEYVALLTMHHIVSDGWSMGVLIKEVAALYEAFSKGEPSPLEELPIQYADYASWQRGWLQGEVLEEQLSYWRQQLGGAPSALELPTDRPRPKQPSHRGGHVGFAFDSELTQKLKELSRREGVTLFMTLLAGWQLLLSRYSGQKDVSVGTPVAGRTHAETEQLIGFFVNTLVLRTDLSGEVTFRGLLSRVREVCLGGYAHQDVPFEKLVEELQPDRDTGRSPLFQVAFTLQEQQQGGGLELPGLAVSEAAAESGAAKFDLTLAAAESGGVLAMGLEYRLDLFDEGTAAQLLGHFERLVRAAAADPDEVVWGLPLLGEEERELLLARWNETEADYEQ